MQRVTSRHNPLVARCRAIARREGTERHLLLLDGPHLVAEALAAGLKIQQAIVLAGDIDGPAIGPLVERLEREGIPVAAASSAVMAAASPVRSPSAIVAIADRPSGAEARTPVSDAAIVVVVCDVQDPGNVGAIVRVSEAAGAAALVVAGQSADPFGWKALRGSMGSALRLPIVIEPRAEDAVLRARSHGRSIVAAVPGGGQSLFDVDLRGPLAVLIGGEGSGLPAHLVESADVGLTIPMVPPVESLNAAVTAALILYEARRQRCQHEPAVP
jgi:TrmH family RNA methyltransferase